ncbi:tetratricopeptide repeat protein 29-like [Haliotis rufescens]|uniref:tetratricopeptide repeat protein 29-like n=1 Tax=Haliotis rufescens TaxID=6454 RepID=UPI001EB07748|nr:tetratricopeptide repeat protein 29-like [Haliotis rufescens]
MAAILPPIKGAVPTRKGQQQTEYIPSPPRTGQASGRLVSLKHGNKEQRMFERRMQLRAEQPPLNKQETSVYRNTYKHNLCLDMLEEGFHMSFRELFALIKQQEDDRQNAGPESIMWSQVMLKDEHEKLDMLKINLTKSEAADRKGIYADVYKARYQLAQYFSSTGDKWLADHFFLTCLQTSTMVEDDGGRTRAEAFCNMGLALEESGDYLDASEHLEAYHALSSENHGWMKDSTLTFYTDACVNLYRIYTMIGRRIEDSDPEAALDLLLKALNMSKDSEDKHLEGEAAYTLGLAYERAGDGETALLHLNSFLRTCRQAEDHEGIGRACDAIAKAYARQGKVDESIEYLKQFVDTAEQSGQETAFSKACHNLGSVFNSLGRYDEASEYFSKAYNISRSMGEASAIHVNRVQYGISLAHRMMARFAKHVDEGNRSCMERLTEWKSARADDFDKPLPDPNAETAAEAVKLPAVDSAEEEEEDKKQSALEEEEDGEDGEAQPEGEVQPEGEKEVTQASTLTTTTEDTQSLAE